MENLRIHYLQSSLHWEDFPTNQQHFSNLIGDIGSHTDLIILPEMFGTGYSMMPDRIAEPMDGPAVTWMRETASLTGAVMMGSLAIRENNQFFNRLICADPDGSLSFYDKKHLFTFAGEHHVFSPGRHQLFVTIKGWRIMPLVCYDLRFPVWSRNVSGYDALIYVANWPAPRIKAWSTLLKARAIENQCYVVGVNRIGEDPNGNAYPGMSAACDMAGDVMHESGDEEEVVAIELEHAPLMEFRKKFGFLADQDRFRFVE